MVFYVALGTMLALFVGCLFEPTRIRIGRCARVLWVCRASLASAALGVALFYGAPPARDLFAETAPGWFYWAVFLVLVVLWALIVHYAARKALEQQAWAARGLTLPLPRLVQAQLQADYAITGTWIPRLLGLLCFASIWLGIRGATKTLLLLGEGPALDAARRQVHALGWVTVAAAVLFLVFLIFRRMIFGPPQPLRTFLALSLKGDPRAIISEPDVLWFVKLLSGPQRGLRAAQAGGLKGDVIAILLVGATCACFVAAIAWPLELGYVARRAWFVPVMLGLPIFAISIVTAWSHKIRFPVLILVTLLLAWLSVLVPRFHDARTLPAKDPIARQVDLADALKAWKKAACQGRASPNCDKHPIIVAAAGGASRAAFLTATVIGDILDITRNDPGRYKDFGTQLFALSGVSGGSIGAIMVRSALADIPSGAAPSGCSTDALWFGYKPTDATGIRLHGRQTGPTTWKACLQSIAAGDFLSPAFVGFAFRDGIAGLRLFRDDRAALLEQAFERRYAAIVDATVLAVGNGPPPRGGAGAAGPTGLRRALGYHPLDPGVAWRPLLLLNATSVETGRRMIASELKPLYRRPTGESERMFPEALDLFEELTPVDTDTCSADATKAAPDMALSTAATLSARFPILSPYAGLRPACATEPADRVVDGGYFENDGVTTAFELAAALRDIDGDLTPIIVHITNDPVGREAAAQDDSATPPPPKRRPAGWFESVLDPVTALFGTRGGHAAEAVRRVLDARPRPPHDAGIEHIRFQVFNQPPQDSAAGTAAAPPKPCTLLSGREPAGATTIDDVSMSWWLSGAVQAYLDRQLCHASNGAEFARLRTFLAP